ncbi:hypothetical protein OK074_2862 [Actinobacteria bacterium OK074]|nr:hypothetical protein OK074_2862 [Actinobacteria bacterium OK074]
MAVRSSTTCRAEFALASGDAGTAFAETNTGLKPAEEAGAYTLPPDLHVVLAPSAVRQSDTSTGPRFARDLGDERLACECVVRADASSAGGRAVYGGRCAAPDPAPDPAPAPWRAPSPRWPTW